MSFQFERSTLGASMVKENNYLLMQINEFSENHPDLMFQPNQEKEKKNLLVNEIDPCGYIVKLFSSLKSQKT